ncbi:MAG: DNA internalization-related competence protein ComEC/Rec2 [Mariprofundus sp.]|nr:DNA internalization-related competence protein ComEC/Rec2 [Mariprofundus sp.]
MQTRCLLHVKIVGLATGLNLRRWPLFVPLLSAMTGLALTRTEMFGIATAAVVFAVFIIILLVFKQRVPALMLVLGALWGMADLLWDASRVHVDADWLAGDMVISADVEQVQSFSAYKRYRLNHIQRQDGIRLPGKALLYQHRVRGNRPQLQTAHIQAFHIQAGQSIRARVRWHEPRNYHNPGAFDYRGWCFDHHIALIGSMKGYPEITDASVPWLEQQRQSVRSVIAEAGVHDGGVLQAVLLGERSQLTEQTNYVFSATGAAHLLAISGMHIGMAATFVFALVWFVLTRREAWIIRFQVRNISLICGCLAAVAYGTMAGWPLPALRAATMLAAATLAWCLASRSEPINTLLAALALILLFDPSAMTSLSLWLSFVATTALLLWAVNIHQDETLLWKSRLLRAGKVLIWISLLATLATLPLIVTTFGRIPVYTLAANLLMVPLYALIVIPAGLLAELVALTGLDTLAVSLIQVAGFAVSLGMNWLTVLSNLPAGQLWAIHPPVWAGLLYMVGMLLSGRYLLQQKRLAAALLSSLVLTLWLGFILMESDVQAPQWIVWDVGQGAASTLLLPGRHVIVVDAPGRKGSRFNGGTTVAAGLRHLGFTHVDVLALSHAQSDHLGGALSLIRSLNSVGQIWLPDVPSAHMDNRVKSIQAYASGHGILVRWLAKGDSIELENHSQAAKVRLSVLWPPRSFDPTNANNTSLVLTVHLPNRANMLWPGDIESEAETALMKAGLEKTGFMLMPHHGSSTSSQMAFLNALHPKLAVAQTGFANRYGFPRPLVVSRYRTMGIDVRNTADGALLLRWMNGDASAEVLQWQSGWQQGGGQQGGLLRRELALVWWKSLCRNGLWG